MDKKLFIGMEETNIDEFVSNCCLAALSIEPLCKICCGECGRLCSETEVIHISDLKDTDLNKLGGSDAG